MGSVSAGRQIWPGAASAGARTGDEAARDGFGTPWRDQFRAHFDESFASVHRYLHRMSGDAELAADLAQETFVRLYRRGAPPDDARAWLFTVATNLLRNARAKSSTRFRLLTRSRGLAAHSDPGRSPDDVSTGDARVASALAALKERDRALLLLAAEGHSYREIAVALSLAEGGVGTLLRRAKRAFKAEYGEVPDAS